MAMELQSKNATEIVIILAVIFVAVYAVFYANISVKAPIGEAKRLVQIVEPGGGGGENNDDIDPTISIMLPTTYNDYFACESSINLAGTASDNQTNSPSVSIINHSTQTTTNATYGGPGSWNASGIAFVPG